ncbi:MAG: hypothetical protein A3K75_02235 [Euryarchaeota archaeon RBG_13_61_15]|nr:MAG: hypothetical protein A3K75_02235 [Euryarchaeota archaeon RBG_13_61_15]
MPSIRIPPPPRIPLTALRHPDQVMAANMSGPLNWSAGAPLIGAFLLMLIGIAALILPEYRFFGAVVCALSLVAIAAIIWLARRG